LGGKVQKSGIVNQNAFKTIIKKESQSNPVKEHRFEGVRKKIYFRNFAKEKKE